MRRMRSLLCVGLVALWGGLAWAGGEGGGRDRLLEDTVRSLNDRIKQLEDEVRRLKAAPPAPRAVEPSGLEKRLKSLEDDFSLLKGLEVHGVLAVDYTYNFNRPRGDKNGLLLFNEDDNTASLDLANIRVAHKSMVAGIGFLADLDFGETAEGVGRSTRWGDSFPNGSENDNFFELRQAYLTYTLPVGNGVSFKAGKFVTLHGAEVIKTWDNINYNISNGILFGWAIPFTHTGILASYPINDFLAVDLGVVNGWDNVEDNNDGKTVHGGVTIKPHPMVSLYLAGSYGPEQEDRGDSRRGLATALLTVKPMDRLTFIIDGNWARESDVCPDSGPCLDPDLPKSAFDGSAEWYGGAAYAIVNVTDRLTFSLRGEWFDDETGIRTGLEQEIWEVTPTLTYTIADGLIARVEYRHDESKRDHKGDRRFHQSHCSNCFINGQDVVAAQLLYAF